MLYQELLKRLLEPLNPLPTLSKPTAGSLPDNASNCNAKLTSFNKVSGFLVGLKCLTWQCTEADRQPLHWTQTRNETTNQIIGYPISSYVFRTITIETCSPRILCHVMPLCCRKYATNCSFDSEQNLRIGDKQPSRWKVESCTTAGHENCVTLLYIATVLLHLFWGMLGAPLLSNSSLTNVLSILQAYVCCACVWLLSWLHMQSQFVWSL